MILGVNKYNMNKLDIKKIIDDCNAAEYEVRVKDIAYCLLKSQIDEIDIAYNCIFDKCTDMNAISNYDKNKRMKFLDKYIKANCPTNGEAAPQNETQDEELLENISFEENKAALVRRLNKVIQWGDSGELSKDRATKLEVEIRKIINDKFGVTDKADEQKIIVYSKYNDICPHCRHEIRRKTDEDMLAEIKEQYDLIPKVKKEK